MTETEPMQPCAECGNDYAEGCCPHQKKPPIRRGRPAPVIRPIDAMLLEIEQKQGHVTPELVMVVLVAYRSLEATHRALKEEMAKHVETIRLLKTTDERMRKQLNAEQKARRRASR